MTICVEVIISLLVLKGVILLKPIVQKTGNSKRPIGPYSKVSALKIFRVENLNANRILFKILTEFLISIANQM